MYQAAAGITVACAYYAYLLGGYPISTIAQLLNERAHGGGVCVYVRILLHLNYNAADHIIQANGAAATTNHLKRCTLPQKTFIGAGRMAFSETDV